MEKNLYNLTNPQKSIWNMEKFFEGTTINNISASINVLDKLNEENLKNAVYNVVKKNDSFRIRLIIKNNIPVQYFSDFKKFEIETINIIDDSHLQKIKEDVINYKFNIIDSNLFCFKIAKFSDGRGSLVFTVHHIIADGWSLGIFAQNVMHEYCKLCGIKTTELQETSSYIEYINSEEKYLQSPKFEKDKNYWLEQFQEIPETVSFTSSENISKDNDYTSKRESFRVNFDVAKSIQEYCNTHKVSMFNFFMSIYSIYLSKTTGLNDFVIRNFYIKSYKL